MLNGLRTISTPISVFYPDHLRKLYVNIFHTTDKELSTIISSVNGVTIILDRAHLGSTLGIRDEGSTVTLESNRKSVHDNPDWSYEAIFVIALRFVLVLGIGGIFFMEVIFSTYYHVL